MFSKGEGLVEKVAPQERHTTSSFPLLSRFSGLLLYGHTISVHLVILYVREKKKKRKVRMKDGLGGLPTRWTFLAIHEEVVERGMKV